MCLIGDLPEEQKQRIIQEARKRGYFRVFKVVSRSKSYSGQEKRYSGFVSAWRLSYKPGKRKTKDPGWHVFLDRKFLQSEFGPLDARERVVTCYAKPGWLNEIAYQDSVRPKENIAATFHTLVFPEWDRGDMTVREFRAACKAKK